MKDNRGPSRKGPARDIYHGHPDTSLHGAGHRRDGAAPRFPSAEGGAPQRSGRPPRTGGRVSVPPARRVDAPERAVPPSGAGERAYRPPRAAGRAQAGAAVKRVEDAPRILPAAAYRDEPDERENAIAGRNPVREALRAGTPIDKLLVAKGPLSGAAREIIALAREKGVQVQMTDRSRLDEVYPANQGMIAFAAAAEYADVDDMLALARERGEEPFLVLLDGITDPYNMGAVIRTAECAGAHGVVITRNRSAGLGPACAKAAAGAVSHMKIARVTNLAREIEDLQREGIWVIGADMEGEDAYGADLTGPVALVIGSEGDGISRLVLEKCDRRVRLPMAGSVGSLNASVAAGILLYEIVRRRKA